MYFIASVFSAVRKEKRKARGSRIEDKICLEVAENFKGRQNEHS